jgi:hypothetical protein
MWNDDEQLAEELNWQPRKKGSSWTRTPRGASAMMAMGGALMLPMWGVTMNIVGSASDLRAVGLILVFGLEGLVAMGIARVLWRVMGPVPRGLIRPLMILGPLPLLAVLCCTGMGLGGVLTPSSGFVSRGKNWGIPRGGSSVRFRDVQALCAKQGPPWRVPREDEVARLDPPPPVARNSTSTSYWLLPAPDANPAQEVLLDVLCLGPRCSTEVRRRWSTGDDKGTTLCVDF